MTLPMRAESQRAFYRARSYLQLGQKVCVARCGGGRATFILAGWSGYWMEGKSGGDDYSPASIVTVDGEPISFLDPVWEKYDLRTGLPMGEHGTAIEALEWALDAGDRIREVDSAEDFMKYWREGGAMYDWPEYYKWLTPLPARAAREGREARVIELLFGHRGPVQPTA